MPSGGRDACHSVTCAQDTCINDADGRCDAAVTVGIQDERAAFDHESPLAENGRNRVRTGPLAGRAPRARAGSFLGLSDPMLEVRSDGEPTGPDR